MSFLAQSFSDALIEFGRKGPFSHAGGIGLGNRQDLMNTAGRQTQTGTRTACNRIGGCYERIGSVIHVEHHTLGAFEQHLGAAV